MSKWYDDEELQGNYIKIPIGEKKTLVIRGVTKKTDGDPKYNLKDSNNVSVGYKYEFTAEDGKILSVSSWSLLRKLKDNEVDAGVEVEINHLKKGEWEIKVLRRDVEIIPF